MSGCCKVKAAVTSVWITHGRPAGAQGPPVHVLWHAWRAAMRVHWTLAAERSAQMLGVGTRGRMPAGQGRWRPAPAELAQRRIVPRMQRLLPARYWLMLEQEVVASSATLLALLSSHRVTWTWAHSMLPCSSRLCTATLCFSAQARLPARALSQAGQTCAMHVLRHADLRSTCAGGPVACRVTSIASQAISFAFQEILCASSQGTLIALQGTCKGICGAWGILGGTVLGIACQGWLPGRCPRAASRTSRRFWQAGAARGAEAAACRL